MWMLFQNQEKSVHSQSNFVKVHTESVKIQTPVHLSTLKPMFLPIRPYEQLKIFKLPLSEKWIQNWLSYRKTKSPTMHAITSGEKKGGGGCWLEPLGASSHIILSISHTAHVSVLRLSVLTADIRWTLRDGSFSSSSTAALNNMCKSFLPLLKKKSAAVC